MYPAVSSISARPIARRSCRREGKSAESLLAFFEKLGPERRTAIKVVTMDMRGAFIKAVRKMPPTLKSSSVDSRSAFSPTLNAVH